MSSKVVEGDGTAEGTRIIVLRLEKSLSNIEEATERAAAVFGE
jgi:hypothetical protein